MKIIISISSDPTRYKESQKNSKKIQKIKKHHYDFFSNQNKFGNSEKEGKWKLSFRSIPTWPILKNSTKIAKKFEKLENWIMASFKPKQVGKARERVNIKIIIPISSYTTRYTESQKNSKKIQKIKKHHCGFFSSQNRSGKPEKEWK